MEYYYINTNKRLEVDKYNLEVDKYKVWLKHNLAFTGGRKSYGEKLGKLQPQDICFMYVSGQGVRAVGKVLEPWDGKSYDKDKELMVSTPGRSEYRLRVDWFIALRKPISPSKHNEIVESEPRFTVRNTVQSIDSKKAGKLLRAMQQFADSEMSLPEEVDEPARYHEGATSRIAINAYEQRKRNRQARDACIQHYGTCCYVCGFSFEATYGEVAEGYIHVHHLVPLSEIREEYEVNPVKDLRPVCPNCHAVIHQRTPPYEPEEVRALVEKHEKHS